MGITEIDTLGDNARMQEPELPETSSRALRLFRWIEPHAPKIGAVNFVACAFAAPILTHGDILSSPAAIIMLIASAGLFFASTWPEWREL